MSLDDWELEVWANAIDDGLKLTCINEDAEEWNVTNKQLARITHHIRSATEWFQRQPMQTRLHRLDTRGWLAQQVYMYVQGRTIWPWQMGPMPMNDVERRLIELWHNDNRRKVPAPPSAINEYTAWWRKAKGQAYSRQQLKQGNQLTEKARKLAHSLGQMTAGSHLEQEVLQYITQGTEWPTSHLPPPTSQLQQEVVTSWWANCRERLDKQWGPRYTPHDQTQAQTLWHKCTKAPDTLHAAATRSGKSQGKLLAKSNQSHRPISSKDIPRGKPPSCLMH